MTELLILFVLCALVGLWTWRYLRAGSLPKPQRFEWETASHHDGRYVHILPESDRITHYEDNDGECPCHPRTERIQRSDGSEGWLFIHQPTRAGMRP